MSNKSRVMEYVFILIVIAAASTLTVLNSINNSYTVDEPNHIAAGLELIDSGTYTVEFQHPPVARTAIAFLPWLYGYKFFTGVDSWDTGKNTLYQGEPNDLVSKARLGVLPFFWLLLIYVYAWARKFGGPCSASLALLLVACCPVVLAHAGLATLDVAVSAFIVGSLYYFHVFLDKPTLFNLLLFSLFNTLAICTKFSAIPFMGGSYLAIFIFCSVSSSSQLSAFKNFFKLRSIIPFILASFLVAWAVYGFSFISLAQNVPDFDKKFLMATEKFSFVKSNKEIILFFCNLKLPSFLVSIPAGIIHLSYHNSIGHLSYLLGEVRDSGWWYFYFVAFFYKTPIIFLGLGITAFAFQLYKIVSLRSVSFLDIPFISIVAIFLFASLFSNINIGIRHLLVIYPLAAVVIAKLFAEMDLINTGKKYVLVIYIVIMSFCIICPLRELGQYLSYFNYFAGNKPEKILINSDFEWGQDYNRLAEEVRQQKINSIFLAMPFAGATDFNRLLSGISVSVVKDNTHVKGWLAVSEYWQAVRGVDLEKCLPVSKQVGKTIKLYYIDAPFDIGACKK